MDNEGRNAETNGAQRGTVRVKRGLAEMLRGGVIMDVVTADQAKIAEDAGAVAVMALERVPADIRRDGGVARMSDPALISAIQEAVTIPVMAKARIGHFVEAQILQALAVDYVDESEVLTPADEAHHIDKWAFSVPFVCGATNLGEALRRISEGAAMIRSKGEAGTGNIVEAVRHLYSVLGDIRKIQVADSAERYEWAKTLQAPIELVEEVARTGRLPVPLFCAGGIATPADAALVMQLGAEAVFVGSGIFKSADPPRRARAIVEATAHFDDAPLLAKISANLGEPMAGSEIATLDVKRGPRSVTAAEASSVPTAGWSGEDCLRIGVLALQGDVAEHRTVLERLGAEVIDVRTPEDLELVEAIVLPGGESTTLSMLLDSSGLFDPLASRLTEGMPAFGTCAGLILLGAEVIDGRSDQRSFGAIDLSARRNAFGRQIESFESDLFVNGLDGEPMHAVFIRAPVVDRLGPGVEVLAEVQLGDGSRRPVVCRQADVLVVAFHPELTGDDRLHSLFLQAVRERRARRSS